MAGPSGNPSGGSGHGGSAGGSSTAASEAAAARAAFFARRQSMMEMSIKYYAAGLCGLIAIFVVFHWTRWLCVRMERSKKPFGVLGRPVVEGSR